jgi:hypothetical protein
MSFYTYVYRDPSRDMEPFYVGKGKGDRARHHLSRTGKHPMTYRLQLMKREGVVPDIEIIPAIDEGHAFFLESCLIEMFGRRDLKKGTLLNLTDGGEGECGRVQSDQKRAKLSAAGRNISPETRAKRSAAAKKRAPMSLETRAKISAAARNISPETRAKMSTSAKGKVLSPETRAKISNALKKGTHHV